MKAHVLTTRHSAASARGTISWPAPASRPTMSSESPWFFGQPRVVKWPFMGRPHDPIRLPTASNRRALWKGLERPARLGGVLEIAGLERGFELAAGLRHLPLLGVDQPEVIADLGDGGRGLRGGGEQRFGGRQMAPGKEGADGRVRDPR